MNRQSVKGAEGFIHEKILNLPKYNAGLADEYVLEKYGIDSVIRLASNENPFGAGPHAQKAAGDALATISKYSDPDSLFLRRALAKKTGVAPEKIVMGNGSEDLICLLSRCFLEPGDRVVTVSPSFLLHEIYPLEQGAELVSVPMTKELAFDVTGIISAVTAGCKMLIFSNPSNPVGSIMNQEGLKEVCQALPPEALVVMDEAYYEYAVSSYDFPDTLSLLPEFGNPHVILRTFSKAYGLAGLRVGYGLFSSSEFADELNKLRTPFNVNCIAQAAALAALEDSDHLQKTMEHNRTQGQQMIKRLHAMGLHASVSHGNFFFVDCGENSLVLAGKLLEKGIIVKPWTAKGYTRYLRVTVGSKEDNDFFLQWLSRLMKT